MAAGSPSTSSAPKGAKLPPWASLATGAASGLASCILLQPMDLLKTRVQQATRKSRLDIKGKGRAVDRNSHTAQLEGRTQRLVRITNEIWNQEGPKGFWRGTAPTVARNVPGVALYFYSVSELRAKIAAARLPYLSLPMRASSSPENSNPSALAKLSTAGNVFAGAIARVCVGFILSPVTVIKAKMESDHFPRTSYSSLSSSLAQIYKTNGIRGLYQGFGATALRDAPYAGIYLAIYESSKSNLSAFAVRRNAARGEEAQNLAWITSASGVFAGGVATFVTHPFDIIKTRIQTRVDGNEAFASRSESGSSQMRGSVHVASLSTAANSPMKGLPRSLGTLATAREIFAHDGLQAFVDGLGLRCARKAASSAIGWSIFEVGTKLWTDFFSRRRSAQYAMGLT